MARNSNSKRTGKNTIQNVRVVDAEEGSDDIVVQRLLSAYNTSEGQIRVVCGTRQEIASPSAAVGAIIGFDTLSNSDDFASFSQQYQEFRVRGIFIKVYDIQPNSSPTINYWSTFHQVGGSVPVGAEDVMDRPDCRSIAPGDGKAQLAWLAHGVPEMQFQLVSNYQGLGGLAYYVAPSTAITGSKYSILVKFIVDFRGRR